MSVLGLVPARSGSKGIPGKALKLLAGRPLLAWTAQAALEAACFDRVILTTDSEEIARCGLRYGLEAPFLRPSGLAADSTPMLPVMRHAIDWLFTEEGFRPDVIVLLQPTAPLRQPRHLWAALQAMDDGADSVVSVVPVPEHYRPEFLMEIGVTGSLRFRGVSRDVRGGCCQCENCVDDRAREAKYEPPATRQDSRPVYVRDGTVYAFRRELIQRGTPYGDDCRPLVLEPFESVNLDSLEDWARAESMVREMVA